MIINLTKEEADHIKSLMYFSMECVEQMWEFMDDEQKKQEGIKYQLSKDIIEKIDAGEKGITYEKKNEHSSIVGILRGIANGPKETK